MTAYLNRKRRLFNPWKCRKSFAGSFYAYFRSVVATRYNIDDAVVFTANIEERTYGVWFFDSFNFNIYVNVNMWEHQAFFPFVVQGKQCIATSETVFTVHFISPHSQTDWWRGVGFEPT